MIGDAVLYAASRATHTAIEKMTVPAKPSTADNTMSGPGCASGIVAQVMAADANVSEDVRSYLGATPQQQQQNAALGQWVQQALSEIAVEEQVPFVDASEAIAPTSEHLADAIHLTPSGEAKLAEVLAEQVNGEW